jgi:DNA-directed RNA polymerase subunit M/transcription elongation factor TFIIS
MPSLSTVVLSLKGELRKAQVKLDESNKATSEVAQAYFRKKATPMEIGHLEYGDLIVYLVGYKEGKSGTENKCPLPAPYDKLILYGDVLLFAAKGNSWENPLPFTVADWERLCETAAGYRRPGTTTAAPTKHVIESPESDGEGEDDEPLPSDLEDEEDEAEAEAEAEDEEEIEVASLIADEEEEEEKPVTRRKKKVVSSQILTGYQRQSTLLVTESHNELTIDSPPHPQYSAKCQARFQFLVDEHGLSNAHITKLVSEIFKATIEEANVKHIFSHWDNQLFQEIYMQRQYKLFSNLHPSSPVANPRLLGRVISCELSMVDLPRLTDMELYPENWKKLQDLQLVKEQRWLEGNKSIATTQFKCNRCHKRECTYYEMQIRSADEPMTKFINCLNCGKRWRQ